jgi:hypothetical protein
VKIAVDNQCPEVLIAELRQTKADLLRRLDRDREAVEELNAIANVPMPPALRSRFLHLKGTLLERYNAPDALEHLLRPTSTTLCAAMRLVSPSLCTSSRDLPRRRGIQSRARTHQGSVPLANKCGLMNLVASLAYLWAEIDLPEGKKTSAATWLVTARDKFAEAKDEDGVENATRLLDRLRAEEEN